MPNGKTKPGRSARKPATPLSNAMASEIGAAAARIFAARINVGRVREGQERDCMEQAVRDACELLDLAGAAASKRGGGGSLSQTLQS